MQIKKIRDLSKTKKWLTISIGISFALFAVCGSYIKIHDRFYKYVTIRNNFAFQNADSNLGLTFGDEPNTRLDINVDPKPPQPSGKHITITAKLSEDNENSEYQFLVRSATIGNDKNWRIVQKYSRKSTCKWDTTGYGGEYLVRVIARTVGSNSLFEAQRRIPFEVKSDHAIPSHSALPYPLKVTLKLSDSKIDNTKNIIVLTAKTNRENAHYEYLFFMRKLSDLSRKRTILQGYSRSATYSWNTEHLAGKYYLHVWARRVGSPYLFEARDRIQRTVKNAQSSWDIRLPSIEISTVVRYLSTYVYSFICNVFGPLPHQIKNIKLMFAFFEGFAIFILFLFIILNLKQLSMWGLLLFTQSIGWFALISYYNDNIGTALRLRIPGVLLLIVLFFSIRWKKVMTLSAKDN